ncbi:MAG TPA: maleylpyruvate isomerase family mycothiol-dependent enzyme [Acidimicrobiales bacterium]|nr:maleylpyruvate isomerase family mycothiol-dependent enzyme [Acidimicrobiales bacterium]
MDPQEHRAAIAAEGERVAAVPPEALGAPVAACPGWDTERLVGHVGRVHRWATAFLAAGPEGDPGEQIGPVPHPPPGAAVLPWYRESVAGLLAELDRHDPAAEALSFAGPTTVAFWFRRQAHEVSVHRWDAEEATAPGRAAPVAPGLAADGIDEWLGFFAPRFLAMVGGPPAALVGASVHLHCTDDGLPDGAGEWLLRLVPGGCEVTRAHAKGDAALRGPASDLLLAVWHRRSLDTLDVVGDATRARQVLDLVHVT